MQRAAKPDRRADKLPGGLWFTQESRVNQMVHTRKSCEPFMPWWLTRTVRILFRVGLLHCNISKEGERGKKLGKRVKSSQRFKSFDCKLKVRLQRLASLHLLLSLSLCLSLDTFFIWFSKDNFHGVQAKPVIGSSFALCVIQ